MGLKATNHAISRYRQRVEDVGHETAKKKLIRLMSRAIKRQKQNPPIVRHSGTGVVGVVQGKVIVTCWHRSGRNLYGEWYDVDAKKGDNIAK